MGEALILTGSVSIKKIAQPSGETISPMKMNKGPIVKLVKQVRCDGIGHLPIGIHRSKSDAKWKDVKEKYSLFV